MTGQGKARSGAEAAARRSRLIALDIDGTILTHSGDLSPRVEEAIRARVEAGDHVVLATGRSVVATMPVTRRLGLDHGYAVCSNGAVTLRVDPCRAEGYEVIEKVTFDPRRVLTLLRAELPEALVAVEHFGVGYLVSGRFPEGELGGPQQVVSWEELLSQRVTRVTLRMLDTDQDEFMAHVESIGLHDVSYAIGWTAWLDINPEGVSKGSALELLRRKLVIEPADTIAVGDQQNDLQMLHWAARGVAMGNAPDEVKAVANEITDSVDDDGLAVVLDSLR